ncbi:ImuA family protein [Asaia bogorensis]|uniref:ImuA family protein n=2 Tax=Asaia bogorensis TaxID=91915 RepID=UPI0011BF0D87|nr:hypothetical protein [Asaia bogorensis]
MDNTALDTLRRRIRQIERRDHTDHAHLRLEIGHDPIDHHLNGGLTAGALHEFLIASPLERGSTLAFLLPCLARSDRPVFWLSTRPTQLFGAGLDALGIARRRLFCLELVADRLLPVAEDILRHAEPMLLVVETDRALTLTEARRLNLAAEATGATGFILRQSKTGAIAAHEACACATRWQITAQKSRPLPLPGLALPLPGPRRLSADLLKLRAGLPKRWILDCHDHESLPRSLDALLLDRAAAPREQRALSGFTQAGAARH